MRTFKFILAIVIAGKAAADEVRFLGKIGSLGVYEIELDSDRSVSVTTPGGNFNFGSLLAGRNVFSASSALPVDGDDIFLIDNDTLASLATSTASNVNSNFSFANFTEQELEEITLIDNQLYTVSEITDPEFTQTYKTALQVSNLQSSVSANSDNISANQTAVFNLTSRIGNNEQNIRTNSANIAKNRENINRNTSGIADAMALSTIQFDFNHDGLQAGVGLSKFAGNDGAAIMFGNRINEKTFFTFSATNTDGAAVAFSFKF